ncbi:MAG: YncE family protein [Chlorobi bacterium]|nr:YncE family protein [Chlorobiota bacterium]
MKKYLHKIVLTTLVAILIASCCKEDFIIPGLTNGIYVYVSCADADSISVINSETLQKVASLTGADIAAESSEPRNSAISTDGKLVFIPCRHSNNVLVIDADKKIITHNITHESFYEPYALAFAPGNKEVWVVNKEGGGSNTGSVSIISVSSFSVTSTIQDDRLSSPEGICFANGKAYIVNRGNGFVSVFNASNRQFIVNVSVGGDPRYAVSSKNGDYVYVTSAYGGLAKINTSVDTVAAVIDAYGRNAVLSPDGAKLFVASQSSSIRVVSTSDDEVTEIQVPDASSIYGVAILSDGSIGFATDENMNVVYAFNPVTGALLNNGTGIPVGRTPRAIIAQ